MQVLWECGGTLAAPAIAAGVIHKALAFIAPKLVSDTIKLMVISTLHAHLHLPIQQHIVAPLHELLYAAAVLHAIGSLSMKELLLWSFLTVCLYARLVVYELLHLLVS